MLWDKHITTACILLKILKWLENYPEANFQMTRVCETPKLLSLNRLHFIEILMCSGPWLCIKGQLIMFVFNLPAEGFSSNPHPHPNPICEVERVTFYSIIRVWRTASLITWATRKSLCDESLQRQKNLIWRKNQKNLSVTWSFTVVIVL